MAAEIGGFNRDRVRVLLLLAAAATDAIVRADGARLHVLRYAIPWEDRLRFDDAALAEQDQRVDWWRRFDPLNGMPQSLRRNDQHIDSLTEQPLLNWLLARILTLEGPEKAATLGGELPIGTDPTRANLMGAVLTGAIMKMTKLTGSKQTSTIRSVRSRSPTDTP